LDRKTHKRIDDVINVAAERLSANPICPGALPDSSPAKKTPVYQVRKTVQSQSSDYYVNICIYSLTSLPVELHDQPD
jgi:hypothetical protein